jgi:LPS O-antigen subunit length determinant protein (WzzB/FepE family)
MRHLILTSSIFFILGLKMTNNIEPNQKMGTDTVHITIPEVKELPSVNEQKTTKIKPKKEDAEAAGSGKLTAPKPSQAADKVD